MALRRPTCKPWIGQRHLDSCREIPFAPANPFMGEAPGQTSSEKKCSRRSACRGQSWLIDTPVITDETYPPFPLH